MASERLLAALSRGALFTISALGGACGDDQPTAFDALGPDSCAEAVMEIGGGVDQFEPLTEGGPLVIISAGVNDAGTEGWFVPISVRAQNLRPSANFHWAILSSAAPPVLGEGAEQIQLTATGDGWIAASGVRGWLAVANETELQALDGQTVELRAELTDDAECEVSDDISVVLTLPMP